MQRREPDGIVIGCDFCGADWDQVRPMVEGHHGSVICLECLKQALSARTAAAEPFACTLCLRQWPAGQVQAYRSPVRPEAVVCDDCLRQAAGAFDRDPEVDWKWTDRASDAARSR